MSFSAQKVRLASDLCSNSLLTLVTPVQIPIMRPSTIGIAYIQVAISKYLETGIALAYCSHFSQFFLTQLLKQHFRVNIALYGY